MKKLFWIILVVLAFVCTGCKEKERPVPVIQEKVIEEITWENVLIEGWT